MISHKSRHGEPITKMLWNAALNVRTTIAVGAGARQKLPNMIGQINSGSRLLVVYQATTSEPWLEELLSLLSKEHYQVTTLEVEDGEGCKTIDWIIRIWEHLQRQKFDRPDTIVALGGGSLTDLAGFAASTYLRGLNLVLVPTSLLAQVDAAIGGKTGINLSAGKNLAGTFYFPKAVLVDQEILSTLPRNQFISGMAEVIKYALIEETVAQNTDYECGPRSLLDLLESVLDGGFAHDDPSLSGIITSCIKMKLCVVSKDPHEANLRRCLNLGHTLGHALEKVTEYRLTHGEAVSIGILCAAKLAATQKRIGDDAVNAVKNILIKAGLPVEIPPEISREKLISTMQYDKKREREAIKMVLPQTFLGIVDYEVTVSLADLPGVV